MRKILMTPGPSPVPPFLRQELGKEIIHHRTDEFRQILSQAHTGLKKILLTENPVIIFASSGTGAMEAAISNLFSPSDKVISIVGGKFGERWSEIAASFGLEVIEIEVEWGKAPCPDKLEKILAQNKNVKAVLTTLCETSTATVYDIKALAAIAKKQAALTVVDAISGLGQDRLLSDQWGVDVVVGGSQKGLMLPPGLSFLSLSPRASEYLQNSRLPKYYFNLKSALKKHQENDTPFTPAVNLIVALSGALEEINREPIEDRWQRFETMAKATAKAAASLGLSLLSASPSASLTAIKMPENLQSSQIVKFLRSQYGLSIAGGQSQLKDKIIRIAHMGWINPQDLIGCFSLLEIALKKFGHQFKTGASLAALEEVFCEN